MDVIIHLIDLREGVDPVRFESWVRGVDYATCPKLTSVRRFSVQRVPDSPSASVRYFEIIEVTSREDFERDAKTPAFQRLVDDFEEMATVVDELIGERVEPGYAVVASGG